MSTKTSINAQRGVTTYYADPNDLTIIGLDTEHGPEHALYDERIELPVDRDFVLQMKRIGWIDGSVVSVRKNGDTLEVKDGRQRVRTAREANKLIEKEGGEPIRCIVIVKADKDDVALDKSIVANAYRYSDPALMLADKIQRYLGRGRTTKEAALVFKLSEQRITDYTKLIGLSEKVRAAVEGGHMSATAAIELADLSLEEQEAELEAAIESGEVSREAVRQRKKNKKNGKAEDGEASSKPKLRTVNKVLKLNKEQGGPLTEDFVNGVLWVLGDHNPARTKGLVALIREAEGE